MLSTLPTGALVCLGAVLLVVAAHTIVWLSKRSAQARGAEPDTSLVAFAVGLCLLALLGPILRLSQAQSVGEVLLLLGVAAAVMAAVVPFIPSPRRRIQASPEGRPAESRPAARPAAPTRPTARRGKPVLPPTPLSRPVEPLTGVIVVPAERPRDRTSAETRGIETRGVETRSPEHQSKRPAPEPTPEHRQSAARDGAERQCADPRGVPQEMLDRVAAQRLAAERLAAGITPRPAEPRPAEPRVAAHDAPTAELPRIRPVDEATQTLVELDRVVDDVSDVLRLGPRETH